MMDKYDIAIAYLTENPDQISEAWVRPDGVGGCLFQWATPTGGMEFTANGQQCGCLPQIRSDVMRSITDKHTFVAATADLTKRIRADHRIPTSDPDGDGVPEITIEHLPMFAEWQRTIDKELDR
jgi:hypothetical protein